MAFNAKNLSYEKKEPSFLRRLRGQYGENYDRHERSIQRPRKLKGDDDDAPTYVVEETNETITKEEYDALVRAEENEDEKTSQGDSVLPDAKTSGKEIEKPYIEADTSKSQQKMAEIGGQNKRKQAKVVGGESVGDNDRAREDNLSIRRPKQKKKKIKLSFDDPEEN